jgi:hypothetical protein
MERCLRVLFLAVAPVFTNNCLAICMVAAGGTPGVRQVKEIGFYLALANVSPLSE